jgi:hypothetical protein
MKGGNSSRIGGGNYYETVTGRGRWSKMRLEYYYKMEVGETNCKNRR